MEKDAYLTIWHIVYIAMIIPTVLGNGLIIWCVIKFEKLRCNMNVLVANLAVSDLIVGVLLIPLDYVADIFHWKTYRYVCLTTMSLFVLSMGSSCYNLLLISVERFITIVYPFSVHALLSKPRFIFMISFGWIVGILNVSIPFYGVDTFNATTLCLNTNVWPEAYRAYLDWILIFALIINFVCYMIVMLIAKRKALSNTTVRGDLQVHSRAKKDFHHFITMVIVLGFFMICWLPYALLGIIVTFNDSMYLEFVKRCTLLPGFLNSSINWIIYGYRNKDYREAFKKTLKMVPMRRAGGHMHVDSFTLHSSNRF